MKKLLFIIVLLACVACYGQTRQQQQMQFLACFHRATAPLWNPAQESSILARWTPESMQVSGGYLTNWTDDIGSRDAVPLVPNSLIVSGNAAGAHSGVWFPASATNLGMRYSGGITNIDNATMFAVFSRPATGITSLIIGSTNDASYPFAMGGSSRPNYWWGQYYHVVGYDQQVTNTGWYYCISSISNGVTTAAYVRVNGQVITPVLATATGAANTVSAMTDIGFRSKYAQCHYGYIVEVNYFSSYATEALITNIAAYVERTYGEVFW